MQRLGFFSRCLPQLWKEQLNTDFEVVWRF
jgi:hypothetical protein